MTKRTKIFKNAMLTLVTAIAAWMSFAADFTGDETWACRKKHLAVVNPVCGTSADDTISLRGAWQFIARTDKRARRNSHDVPFFPDIAPWDTARMIQVPGCWEAQGVGEPGESEPWAFRLDCSQKPLRHVLFGEGWYRKKVRIPEAWRDKRVWIKIGGLNARGWIWVNRHQAAHVANYCGTYKYDVTDCVTPGAEAEIIVQVDNHLKGRKGCFNNVNRWGGIYRDIELEATPQTYIDDAWVRGDFDGKAADVKVKVGGDGKGEDLRLRVEIEGERQEVRLRTPPSSSSVFTLKFPLADFRPWSPEHPNLYTGIVELVENGGVVHSRRERFGVRKIAVKESQFYLNDKPFFVRGFGDDSVYPITGVPPADREFHLRHLLTARRAGFNLVRLHTHCEVPEYFEAADEAGILVQPELPYINGDIPTEDEVEFDPVRDFLELHANFRRYVSFAVYSNGNEGSFGRRLDEYLYALAKKLDPDRLKIGMDTQFARFNPKGTSDYEGGPVSEWPRGSINPDRPFVCHEYLNRTVKLDARLEGRFTGVWKPPVTLSQRREFLAGAGLNADWGDRLQRAQHALQKYWHKSGVEAARADPFCDGYCLWTIVDVVVRQGETFTAQGVFNPFWEAKEGGATPESLALFNSPSVVLLDVKGGERVFRSGDSCKLVFMFAHYGDEILGPGTHLEWTLAADGGMLASGREPVGAQRQGPVRNVAAVPLKFPDVPRAMKATLTASVGGTGMNSWEFWLFPKRDVKDGSFIAVSDAIRPAFSALYANMRSEADVEHAEIVVAEEGSALLAAASKRGQRTISLGNVDRSPLGKCRLWEVGREIDTAAQEAYRTPSQDISLGWWSMRNQVGAAIKSHPSLAFLPHEGFLSPLLFGTIGKGRKLPFSGAGAESLIIVSEGRDVCHAHLAEIENGRQMASWGLELLSGRPEATAILDGMISHLANRANGASAAVPVVPGCARGSIDCVKASSFGWNATNATKCLQAAFDSGAAKVVIDRQAGEWIIEPVFLRSDQEVVIEADVVVRSMKGAYKHPSDCLFTVSGVSNVVLRGMSGALLRMERDDYTNRKEYRFSEWRHALYIMNSFNVRISDLALRYSGGDGIYVGGRSSDIDIRRVDCRDHYRQGISITSARNLIIADSRFTATKGTPPQCGIDFEPNKPSDRLSGCLVENCEFDGNASSGILFHLTQLDETTEPVSITVRNCRSNGNAANGLTMTIGANGRRKPVKGEILIEGCRFAGNKSRPMVINGISHETASVMVKDTHFDGRCGVWSGFLISNNGLFADVANLVFDNCRLVVDKEPAIEFSSALGGGVKSIGGTLSVECGGKVAPFDFGMFAAKNRPDQERRKAFGGRFIDYCELRPIAPDSVVKQATPMCRGKFTFLQYLPREGEYTITFMAKSIAGRKLNCPVQMRDMMGTDIGAFSITAAVQKVSVKTAGRNLHRFEIDTCGNTVAVSSPYPGQGLLANAQLSLFRESCRLYFAVPDGAEKVHVAVTPEEPVVATLLNAVGEPVASMPRQTLAATLTGGRVSSSVAVKGDSPHRAFEVWSLDIKAEEDVLLRLGSTATQILATEAASGLMELQP